MIMAILKMGKNTITQISLIWVTISLTTAIRSENIPRITNLDCINDPYEKIYCFWEVVDSNSNCSEDFALSYTDFEGKKEKCRDLRNEQLGDSTVPNKCLCNITVRYFTIEEIFKIEVESHGKTVGNTTIYIRSTIRPRAPSNVRVDFQEEQNGVVKWDIGYSSTLIRDSLSFQVQIICKHNREVALQHDVTETAEYYFSKKQLKRGENYEVRVRAKPVRKLEGTWSEWSAEADWENDYSLNILDLKDIIIPVICIVMLCLIIVIYLCLTRYKKKWWDTVPNPGKSMIVKRKLIQKHQLISYRKHNTNKSCGGFFSRIVKAHKYRCDQLTQHETARHYVINIVSSDCKKCIFEPKNEDIERCVEMHPKWEDESNLVQEGKPEHKAEDQPLEDLSIANMFFAILHDSSSTKVDTFENLNAGAFGSPALMDNFNTEEKLWSNLNVPGQRKLGYHNHDSDDSSLDSSSNRDVKVSCFDQWPDNQIYIPKVSIKSNGDLLASPAYNSFANAVSQARPDFVTDTTKTLCLDSFSKSNVHYNTTYFHPHISEDSYKLNIKPKSGHVIFHCHESKTHPTSICQESGYQSFDRAVQENEPELRCHVSGYKSLDQAVQQGDETSASEINEYRSYDQAVQESHPGFVCHGFKGFDKTVQKGDNTSVREGNGYQSFDQALQESENSGSTNCSTLDSGCKPFESFICQNNDYTNKNDFTCENDHLRDGHCENNTNFGNSHECKLFSSNLMELIYSKFAKAPLQKYPSFSDKPSKIAVDFNNDLTLKHESIPLALTFDICEHMRNLEDMHGHKMLLSLQTGTVPINEAIFLCNLDKISFTQEQLPNKKHLFHKCPSTTCTFENTSFFMPLYDLDVLDSSLTSTHLLIQQSSLDKDGNSYMKIK